MAEEQKTYPRFSVSQRLQHWVMTISFAVLAITGLPQRYALAGWAEWMIEAMGGIETVRIIHRLSAVVLILVTVFHFVSLAYAVLVKRSRMTLLPGLKDVTDLLDSVRYSLGLAQRHPRFPHFSVAEKIEYWALIWGTVVMVITGLILWFPEKAVRILPALAVTVSQTIHYYEACLATLAILVWHFFFVIFHPDAYPMSWTWLTGKMSRDDVERHHAKWYEEELTGAEDPGTSH